MLIEMYFSSLLSCSNPPVLPSYAHWIISFFLIYPAWVSLCTNKQVRVCIFSCFCFLHKRNYTVHILFFLHFPFPLKVYPENYYPSIESSLIFALLPCITPLHSYAIVYSVHYVCRLFSSF